jgi:translation initiation factor 2B subunit (eIF-2B alpha/beta/delta family)
MEKMRAAIGYVRVSTSRQGESGIGLDAQRMQLKQYAEDRGYRIKQIFTEIASATSDQMAQRPIVITHGHFLGWCAAAGSGADSFKRWWRG